MTTNTWQLRVDSTSKPDVINWLAVETTKTYDLRTSESEILLEFHDIDDAFRFRMHFDATLIH